jgi:KDO2-lipid IV(A) lauroyltransferase
LEGKEWLEETVADGRGVVVVLPHLGNWEMAGVVVWDMDVEVVAVAENLANPHIRDWFTRVRALSGIKVEFARRGLLRTLERKLATRTAVCLPSDRDLSGRGVPVVFFGEETTLPAGPLLLGIRSGRPVIPAAVYGKKKSLYRAVLKPPLNIPREGRLSERLSRGAQLMADAFEDLIKAAPEQWHLLQPNWPSDRA